METIYELIFYSIVFGIPLWELYKAAVSAKSKDRKMEQKIESMQTALEGTNQKLLKMLDEEEQRAKERHYIVAHRQRKLEEAKAEREKKRYNMLFGIAEAEANSSQMLDAVNGGAIQPQ